MRCSESRYRPTISATILLQRTFVRSKCQGKSNAGLTGAEVEKFCRVREADHELLDQAMDRLGFRPGPIIANTARGANRR